MLHAPYFDLNIMNRTPVLFAQGHCDEKGPDYCYEFHGSISEQRQHDVLSAFRAATTDRTDLLYQVE